ncbi:MAG: hypothetical protein ACR65Z_07225 [Methylocystis sp.]
MQNVNDKNHYYPGPGPLLSVSQALVVAALFGILAGIAWLDSLPVQVLGWIIFPFEYALNAVFFPAAHTQLNKNGSALVVILEVSLLIYLLNRITRAIISAVLRVASFFRR